MSTATLRRFDRVYVVDKGLAKLRAMVRQTGSEPEPNHHGYVEQVWADGYLIKFDGGATAPYPFEAVRRLTAEDRGMP